jgi:hypothetical protein
VNGSKDIPSGGRATTRAAAGGLLLAAAPLVSDRYGATLRHPVLWGIRLLALRHLVEAAALAAKQSPGVRRGIALGDTAHGASMLVLAFRSRTLRSLALGAATEACWLALTTYSASASPPGSPS